MVLGGLIVVAALLTALGVAVIRRPSEQAGDAGARLLAEGDYRAAIPVLLRAVTIRADDAWAHHRLGLAYARIGWHRAALSELSAAVRLVPRSAEFREALGCAYRDAGDVVEAVKEFEEAVRLAPEQARYHVRLAGLLLDVGSGTEAIQHLKEAVRLRPSPEIRSLLTRVLSEGTALAEAVHGYPEVWRLAAGTAAAVDGCQPAETNLALPSR
jgi:Flp pilus assembly protein TadD